MQHIRLLVGIGGKDDICDDVLNDLKVSSDKSDKTSAYVDLSRLVRLDLFCIPNFLICLTCLEVDVVLQSKLDKEIVVA